MIGTKVAHYEITSHLGSGGMGDVYQASDPKLGRDVAIKFLPESFAHDSERVARFEREARVLASLNHPNIAAIYGIEQAASRKFLVMELVGGETLAERIRRGPLPIDEALAIAKQICEALEAAHEKGIIHRDLKPANIKVTPEGNVKVLDFGLAKAFQAEPSNGNMSNSPTLSFAATNAGVILGTAAYMSPEQAKGRATDRRTDIFAFGSVLYEMLTASRAFEGEDIAEILSRVLQREPDWKLLPASVPPRIRELLRLCLQKNSKNRRSDAADVRLDIEQAVKEPDAATVPIAVPVRNTRVAWIVAVLATLAFASLAIVHFREKPADLPEMRVDIDTPATSAPLEFALSPAGRHIVFVASGDGPQKLWLRALDKTAAQPMAGTDGADYPFWSPDSQSIGFFASGKVKRVDISGGLPQVLANAVCRGGTWNADGTIICAPVTSGALSRVSVSSGREVTTVLTHLQPGQNGHRWPQFLPDGRHFLYYAQGTPESSGIYLESLDGGEPKRLTSADTHGAYLDPATIVFISQGALLGQHLDVKQGALTGQPVRLADPVSSDALGLGAFSVSSEGRLAYRAGGVGLRQLAWYDRTGKTLGAVGDRDASTQNYPEVSPDGQRLAIQRMVQNNIDIWLMDIVRGGLSRFTTDPGIDSAPLWSPDGMKIAFSSNRKGVSNLYLKASSGVGAEELVLETPNGKNAQDWSKDGRFLLYRENDPKSLTDLWALPMTGNDRKPIVVASTMFSELNGQFSPDGHWVAYQTDESGQFEIVVQPFPELSGKWPVSTSGGIEPRWRSDGKELYFIAPDGMLMAAPVTSSGVTFARGKPVALFPARIAPGRTSNRQQYAVSRDGRFLINQPMLESAATPITLILNWKPKVQP